VGHLKVTGQQVLDSGTRNVKFSSLVVVLKSYLQVEGLTGVLLEC